MAAGPKEARPGEVVTPIQVEALKMSRAPGLAFVVSQEILFGQCLPVLFLRAEQVADQAVGIGSDILQAETNNTVAAPEALGEILGATVGKKIPPA